MTGNDFMAWVLRSPFHRMLSKNMLLITVRGRKTGRQYTTPVEYYEQGGYLWVLTRRERTWWRNVKGGAEVSLCLNRKAVSALGETIECASEVEAELENYAQRMPVSARALGLHQAEGVPNAEEIRRVAQDRLFVRLKVY